MSLEDLLDEMEARCEGRPSGGTLVMYDRLRQLTEAGRLALDMGEALRATQRFCGGCVDADALLARLDGIANKDKTT